jgi:uncharacterized protein
MKMVNNFSSFFSKKHNLFPVVHIVELNQACRNAEIAFKSGADGIFLINHDSPTSNLLDCYNAVRKANPGAWIGLNFLDRQPIDAVSLLPPDVDGLWVDDGGISEDHHGDLKAQNLKDHLDKVQGMRSHPVLLFGGVAFKYQQPVNNLSDVAVRAMECMDVVTTSGPQTGSPADVSKIEEMKNAIGEYPIGLASGVGFQNIFHYRSVSAFLVASSICSSFEEFDHVKLGKLVECVSEMNDLD